jgi:hypothetical protein
MMENIKKRFTGQVYAENMWHAARAYTAGKHEYFMKKVFENSPQIETC